ncbi:MAG: hypothetical protein Q4B94_00285 [Pseudomonadota bacterium]|nr:hypothetical protein [Pseudomonadota bacterium]
MSQPGKSETQLDTSPAPAQDEQQQGQAQQPTDYGGFNTLEELVAAYESAKSAAETSKAPQGTPGNIPDTEDAKANSALTAAGLDAAALADEFAANGALSESSLKALEDKGFSRDMVAIYLDGLRSRQEAYSAAVFKPAGGEAEYNSLIQWAAANLSEGEKKTYNEAIGSGDADRAAFAVTALVAKRGQAPTSKSGVTLHGKPTANAQGVQPFASTHQVVQAMRDPRYRNDPAYRQEVTNRLRVSQVLR